MSNQVTPSNNARAVLAAIFIFIGAVMIVLAASYFYEKNSCETRAANIGLSEMFSYGSCSVVMPDGQIIPIGDYDFLNK